MTEDRVPAVAAGVDHRPPPRAEARRHVAHRERPGVRMALVDTCERW